MKPPIQYTKSGDINIAYQVFGSGPIDLVYIPGWISNIDWMWACPELVAFFTALTKVARVILFDKRGTGLSDRITEFATLEERMEDIKAVMDAIHSEKAILFGHSEGGSVSALFSATYPNRVIALIAFGIFAKRRYTKNYPWAPTDQERQKVYDMIEHHWGSGDMNLQSLAPSKADDQQFMDWLSNYFRYGASPGTALTLTKMNTQIDIVDILKYVQVPTLLLQRTDDIDVKVEEGRYIANHIENAQFVELPGNDHLFWAGNTQEVLDEMIPFIKKTKPAKKLKEGLITIVLIQLNSLLKISARNQLIEQLAYQFGGRMLHKEKNIILASFQSSGDAVAYALHLGDRLRHLDIFFSIGLYLKKAFHNSLDRLDPRDRYLIKMMIDQTNQNQIFVSQSIKFLLTGSIYRFAKECSILDYNSYQTTTLYSVSKETIAGEVRKNTSIPSLISTYDSFMEDLLQIIDDHLEDPKFGIRVLAKKLGIGERQLQRKIKETSGKSPVQLINLIRLHKAKSALMLYKYSVAEITFQFGFSCPSYFTKCFKKEFGISPTDLLNTPNRKKIAN
ncbi:alpha/beta fold hydrolase [Aquimarina latercula]|uniref:alpha/beta fold hydrolase n=1 Tax=Aquimarina latercula TaxID=987 RepID=UPI00042144DD|nr:alpha/beta fold hydrolase [Aquimarina latercula]